MKLSMDPPTHVYTAPAAPVSAPGKTRILGKLGLVSHIDPSITVQDLTRDKLLEGAQRVEVDGKVVPSIGGIPLFGKLGHSVTAAVYYGIRPETRMHLAVKVFPLAGTSPEILDRLAEQIKHASVVQSKFVVRVKEFNKENGLCYITMEFVAGVSAAAYLNRVKASGAPGLPEAVALDICIAATEGLAQAHRDGVMHGDVRPANILIPKRGADIIVFPEAKLADIGVPRIEELGGLLSGSNAPMGAPGYMAPEQAVDAKAMRKSADVYSMGATLYDLLAGHPPFEADNPMNAILASLQQKHDPVSKSRKDVSPATCELIDRCLAKQPGDRYVDGSALLEAMTVCRAALTEPKVTQTAAIKRVTMVLEKSEVGKKIINAEHTPSAIDFKSLGVDPSAPKPRDTKIVEKRASGPAPLPARISGERSAVTGERGGTQMQRKPAPASEAAATASAASVLQGPVKYLLGVIVLLLIVVVVLLVMKSSGGGKTDVDNQAVVDVFQQKLIKAHSSMLQQAKERAVENIAGARAALKEAQELGVDSKQAKDHERGVDLLIQAHEMVQQNKEIAEIEKVLQDAEKLMPGDASTAFLKGLLAAKKKQ